MSAAIRRYRLMVASFLCANCCSAFPAFARWSFGTPARRDCFLGGNGRLSSRVLSRVLSVIKPIRPLRRYAPEKRWKMGALGDCDAELGRLEKVAVRQGGCSKRWHLEKVAVRKVGCSTRAPRKGRPGRKGGSLVERPHAELRSGCPRPGGNVPATASVQTRSWASSATC